MSHVAKVDVEITNLDDLDAACKRIGLELVRGQQTYQWYGTSVGDYPLPEGFTVEDLGRCDHAIRIPLDHPYHQRSDPTDRPYEIGVVKRRDGKPGYMLMWDFFCGGMGLSEFTGQSLDSSGEHDGQVPRLKQAYAICAARRVAQQRGFRLQEQALADGTVKMFLTK